MRLRPAFTMLELIFVIVIMGIIGKFGVEFLAQAYRNFISSTINNTLQANSANAVEFIASRLQYRIKDSIIARTGETTTFTPLADASGETFVVLEWVSSDIDNFRATTTPNWSGIIDLDAGNANLLVSPATNTTDINSTIFALSHGNSGVNDAALYFIGSNQDIDGYGWNGTALADQNGSVMHPIKQGTNANEFVPRNGATNATNSFTGVNVYEYYQLTWTANAVVMENYNAGTKMGDLVFYYDYQPWNGEMFYTAGQNIKKFTIMENVSTFQAMAIGSIVKIQLCTKSDLMIEETYSLCKEKTIF
ncbi:MAG: type II secretion system protein [Sulfurimonas sp.]|nr:type II secretion system protein [Sulfurimonas sp.]MBU3938245.1 type II secretion system GspH family protein [bacterium]MBU4024245.1 type II secretion system GspH family protein [bacterium]MBU4058918.1 type II secretion system GspH family protein [bacterium]MBU4110556.1 type II secretion system GspH family protein [bacterium]